MRLGRILRAASKVEHDARRLHVAVLVHGGKIVSVAGNDLSGGRTLYKHSLKHIRSCHAEVNAIKRALRTKFRTNPSALRHCTLYSLRLSRNCERGVSGWEAMHAMRTIPPKV